MLDDSDRLGARAETSDDRLVLAAVERVNAVALNTGWRPDALRSLPRVLALPWRTRDVENEVLNGGYFQYFWNGGGEIAAETADDFQQMEAHQFASIQRSALATYVSVAEEFEDYRARGNSVYRACMDMEGFQTQDREFMSAYAQRSVTDLLVIWLSDRIGESADALTSNGPPGHP